jgi:BirA family biotin operon repressor/biotin-[acetyl-CoA-carboxylase] ligase
VTGADLGHGFRLLELATVASTNDVARRLADAGEPAGLIVRAERQTAGRGRHGRTWQSPPGNLYASLLLRPTRPMVEVASLSLIFALALAEAVEDLSGGRLAPRLKWPNDVLIDGAKLAGILLESVADPRRDLAALIVGLGVNVEWAPTGDLPYPATSLASLGLAVTPRRVLAALVAPLRARLDRWETAGFATQREDWLARAAGRGGPVEARIGERVVRGTLVDLEPGGALCVERADGTRETLSAGELVIGGANGLALPTLGR